MKITKKMILTGIACCFCVSGLVAGGLVSNVNQSAAYFRTLSRGATTSGDAVYYNPAGLGFLEDGFTISLNSQMIWMQRTITNDLSALKTHLDASGNLRTGEFIGNLYVPVFPGIYATYKTGNWAFSLGFNPPAGGGSVEFDKGLPMLELPFCGIPGEMSKNGIPTENYRMTSKMKGSSICYGIQAGATYKINDMFSVFGGVRMLFANNSYEGYLKDIQVNPKIDGLLDGKMLDAAGLVEKGNYIDHIADNVLGAADPKYMELKMLAGGLKTVASKIPGMMELDATQKGKGIAPILGFHFRNNGLNLAAKYEFQTSITLTSDPKKDDLNMYPKDKKLRSDVPALLSLAGSYDIIPALTFSATYLHHFEPQATIESWDATNKIIVQRQDLIDRGTNEYMAGLEWKLNKKLTLSAGGQYSDVGVSDKWQNDITHNLDNFTVGLGAAYQFTDRLTLNIGGLNTWYKPASVTTFDEATNTKIYTQKYERTNKAIAIGLDYRF